MQTESTVRSRLLTVFSIILATALLVASTYGGYLWVTRLVRSVYGYRSPLRAVPRPYETTRPLTTQLVVVLVSGLREDVAWRMPTLRGLRQRGAWGVAQVPGPTCTQPTWTTLLTGAPPELNDAPLLANEPSDFSPLTVDHLFAAAKRAGLSIGLVGRVGWERLFPLGEFDVSFLTSQRGEGGDRETVEKALFFLREFHPNLLLLQLGQLNETSLREGALSAEAFAAAERVDAHLRDLVENLDLARACLLITADHGQLARGGYGGEELPARRVPLVMVGRGVRPGALGVVSQTDIAPTVAALLGMPTPGIALGEVLENALVLDPQVQAEKRTAFAAQRVALAKEYLVAIGGPPLSEVARGDVLVARSSLEVGNYRGASQLAGFSLAQAREEMSRARQKRLFSERLNRVPLGGLALLIPLYVLLRYSTGRSWFLFFCATLSVAVYHGLYLWEGGIYSLSTMTSPESLVRGTLYRTLPSIGIGGLLALAGILIEGDRSLLRLWTGLLSYGLQTVYLLICPLACLFILNGITLAWFLPSLKALFLQIFLLLQLVFSAAILAVWPIPFVLLGVFIRLLSWVARQLRHLITRSSEAFYAHRYNR